MKNDERFVVEVIKRYCEEQKINYQFFSHGWICRLYSRKGQHIIWGYDFGVNSSVAARIMNDKSATYECLEAAGLKAIPHALFLEPERQIYISEDGAWDRIIKMHRQNGLNSVVKANEGTGGNYTFHVKTFDELESAVFRVFQRGQNACISPYVKIEDEMRIYIIEDEPFLSYRKERAFVIGDGTRCIAAIIADKMNTKKKLFIDETIDLMAVPKKGDWIQVQWRHNLGHGARLIRVDVNELGQEIALARQAIASVGAKAASVDLVRVNSEWAVGEINSGIMLENAVNNGEITKEEGYALYNKILNLVIM